MTAILIRLRDVAVRAPVELVLSMTDRSLAAQSLRAILHELQKQRGRGRWSNADPEILVDGALVARLRSDDTIEELVEHVLERAMHARP